MSATNNNTARAYIQITDQTAGALKQMTLNMNTVQNNITNVNEKVSAFSANSLLKFAGIAAAIAGVTKAAQALAGMFKEGLQFNMDMETTKNGLAAIIAQSFEIKKNGIELGGMDKFNAAVKVSEESMKRLKIAAITSGASVSEAFEAARNAIGPGAGTGLSMPQIEKMAITIANTAKVLGMQEGQAGQEMRAIMSGKIDNTANIGKNLMQIGPGGRNQAEYKKALKAGGDEFFNWFEKATDQMLNSAEIQAKSLAGIWDSMKDSFQVFKGEIASGLQTELEKVKPYVDSLFDLKTSTWSEKLIPLMTTLQTIGSYIGTEIVDGFKNATDNLISMGQAVEEDQSGINGMSEMWEIFKDGVIIVVEIFGVIFGTIIDICSEIFNTGKAQDDVTGKVSETGAAMKVLVGFLGTIKIALAFIKDLVQIIADVFRLALGGAIAAVAGALGLLLEGMADIASFAQMDGASAALQRYADASNKVASMGYDMATKNNKTMQLLKESANSPYDESGKLFSGTSKSAEEVVASIENAGNKKNSKFAEMVEKTKQKQAEAEAKRLKDKQDKENGIPYNDNGITLSGKGRGAGKDKTKKGSSKGSDPTKAAFEGEMSALDKFISYADKAYARLSKIEEERLKSQEISTVQFYERKEQLLEADIAANREALEKQLQASIEYQAKAKTAADKQKAQNKVDEIKSKIADTNEKFGDTKTQLQIEKKRALQDVIKKNNDYELQYLDIAGRIYEAEVKRINLKIDEALLSKDLTEEARKQLEAMRMLEVGQAKINDEKRKYSILSDSVSTAERNAELLKSSGSFGELGYLAKVRDIRQANYQEQKAILQAQVADYENQVKKLESEGGDKYAILDLKNKAQEAKNSMVDLNNNLDPLATSINEMFSEGFSTFASDIISGNKSIKDSFLDLAKSIEQSITSLISQELSKELMKSLFSEGGSTTGGIGGFFSQLFGGKTGQASSGASAGGFLSSLFSGGGSTGGGGFSLGGFLSGMFAEGGDVLPSSKPILVGENEPELWIPRSPGTILNGRDMKNLAGGGKPNFNINFTVNANDAGSFNRSKDQIMNDLYMAMDRSNRRNG